MFTLTREPGSVVFVDGPAAVYFHEWKGGKVRLAFEAPAETKIVRGELLASDYDRNVLWGRSLDRAELRRRAMRLVEDLARAPDETTGTWGDAARKIMAEWPREEDR